MPEVALPPARKTAGATFWRIAGYGALCGLLLAALRFTEYRFLVLEHSVEIWGGLIAALFATLGIFVALRLTRAPASSRSSSRSRSGSKCRSRCRCRAELLLGRRAPPEGAGGDRARARDPGAHRRGPLQPRDRRPPVRQRDTVKTHSSRLFDQLGGAAEDASGPARPGRRPRSGAAGPFPSAAGLLPGGSPHPKA